MIELVIFLIFLIGVNFLVWGEVLKDFGKNETTANSFCILGMIILFVFIMAVVGYIQGTPT